MLVTPSSGYGLVIHSTQGYMLWVFHPSRNDFIQDGSQPHSIWNTVCLVFIPIYDKSYSTITPTSITTATNIFGSQSPFMFAFLPYFVVPPKNLNAWIFPTGIYLSVSIPYFLNSTKFRWSFPFLPVMFVLTRTILMMTFTNRFISNIMCPFFIVKLFHTLPHNTFWTMPYYELLLQNFGSPPVYHMSSNNFCSPLKSENTLIYDTHNWFLESPSCHLNKSTSTTNLCLDLSSGEICDLDAKEIGRKRIPSGDL